MCMCSHWRPYSFRTCRCFSNDLSQYQWSVSALRLIRLMRNTISPSPSHPTPTTRVRWCAYTQPCEPPSAWWKSIVPQHTLPRSRLPWRFYRTASVASVSFHFSLIAPWLATERRTDFFLRVNLSSNWQMKTDYDIGWIHGYTGLLSLNLIPCHGLRISTICQ